MVRRPDCALADRDRGTLADRDSQCHGVRRGIDPFDDLAETGVVHVDACPHGRPVGDEVVDLAARVDRRGHARDRLRLRLRADPDLANLPVNLLLDDLAACAAGRVSYSRTRRPTTEDAKRQEDRRQPQSHNDGSCSDRYKK